MKDGATTGKVGFVDSALRLPAAVNEHVFRLKVDEAQAVPRYVFYYLLSPWGNREILLDFRGATVGGISQDFPERVRVPLPGLPVQRRIAGILDKADRLRRMRRYALELSDQFLPALFLRMFGDPAENPRGWNTVNLGELAERVTKGESPNWQGFAYQDTGILFVTSENVGWGQPILDKRKYISEEFHSKLRRSQLRAGDLLINLVGASIGRACLVGPAMTPGNVNQAVCVVTLDPDRALPLFVLTVLLTPQMQRRLLGESVESARANISLGDVADLRVAIPPTRHQLEFADAAGRVSAQANCDRESLRQAEHLFHSLLNQYFGKED